MAHQDLDWLCVDTQHGVIGYDAAVPMLQAISTSKVTPVVRVPWNEPSIIMKMLDAGAYGVIVPMVNDRAQGEAAAGEYVSARRRIVEGCHRHGVIAGVNSTARTAVKRIEEGFRLILVTGDAGGLARAAREDIRAVWQGKEPGEERLVAYQ